MSRNVAVIDMGSNTFHLLCATIDDDDQLKILHRHRQFVHLSEGGAETIIPNAWQRGIKALQDFANSMEPYEISELQITGTAILRNANNAQAFIQEVKDRFGWQVRLLSGLEEANYIHDGVTWYYRGIEEPMLIMDIGGGSVEFIISEKGKIHWIDSINVGISYLKNRFDYDNYFGHERKANMTSYLQASLSDLSLAIARFKPRVFIGASGTFEVLADNRLAGYDENTKLDADRMKKFVDQSWDQSVEDLKKHPAIPEKRAKLFHPVLVLLDYVLDKGPWQDMCFSPYALKEGLLKELILG